MLCRSQGRRRQRHLGHAAAGADRGAEQGPPIGRTMSVRAGLRPPPLRDQLPHRRAPAAQPDGRGDGNHECARRKEPDSCRGAATVDRVPAAARMAPPAAPRAADADVLCFRFGRPVYVNQYPPLFHYTPDRPGIQISGRFPIDIWPRPLQWAFEWHDTAKDLILRRGEPLFYVRLDGPDPAAPTRLIEA